VLGEPLFSVIVLSWNSLRYLPQCLASLRMQSCRSFEVWCVDNGSTDGSREWLMQADLGALVDAPAAVILHDTNTGFAAGMNSGLRRARGRWVLPLNVDVVLADDFLSAALAVAERHPDAAMIGPVVYGYDYAPTQRVDTAGIWPTKHLTATTRLETAGYEASVFGPAGCCPLLLRAIVEAAALPRDVTGAAHDMVYDELYFAYGEDVDLYLRLQLLGFRCVYAPKVRAWHVHSGTQAGVRWYEKDAATMRRVPANAFFTLVKNCPAGLLLRLAPHVLGAPLAQAMLLLWRTPRQALWPLAAYVRMARHLLRAVRVRAWLQPRRQRSARDLMKWFYN